MWRLAESGAIGSVRVAYAEANWNRIESWHPRPEAFYRHRAFRGHRRVPADDPDRHVRTGPAGHRLRNGRLPRPHDAHGRALHARRAGLRRRRRRASASGIVVRVTANFYVSHLTKQRGIELHGDTGSIFLSDWQEFDATVELAPFGDPYEPVEVENPFHGIDWGRALDDLSEAIVDGTARTARPAPKPPTSSRSSTRSRSPSQRAARSRSRRRSCAPCSASN